MDSALYYDKDFQEAIVLHNWYRGLISAVLWNSSTSRSFNISQGVRQGAILSPLLYSIYVNDLLYQLSGSGYGATIDGNFCGSPMYADDLALIANSSTDLQAMLAVLLEGHSSLSTVLGLGPAASIHLHPCACTKYTASLFSSTGAKCGLSHRQS